MSDQAPTRQFCFAVKFSQASIREDPGQLRAVVHGCLRMHWEELEGMTNAAAQKRLRTIMGFEVPMQLVALQRSII